jgi:hypothetical protein
MLINDKSIFSIECEVRHKSDDFVFCNFRFWIAGNPIGDWSQEVVLGVLIHSAKVFMLYQGNRHLEQADRLSAELLWRHIDRFTHSDDPEDLKIGLEERYRPRFLIHDIADDSVATVCEVVVVDRADGIQRLLWKFRDSDNIQEATLPKLTVDNTVFNFIDWAETASSPKY